MPMPTPSLAAGSSEVVADPTLDRPRRRAFSAEYKRRIVAEAEACTDHGQVAAMLRREGIYSSSLSQWRQQLKFHGEKGLVPKRTGRKPQYDDKDLRIAKLEREKRKLERELDISHKLIALQKKAQELLAAMAAQEDAP